MHKFLLITLLTVTTTAFCHDPIQDAILNSDYETVAKRYNAQETTENVHRAYLSIAEGTANMRDANLCFEWCKAFISKKLLLSLFFLRVFDPLAVIALRNFMISDQAWPNPYERQLSKITDFIGFSGYAISFVVFISALLDGNKYYHQLQDKIKDAERIKFLLMAQS